jgi:hypothetical protein
LVPRGRDILHLLTHSQDLPLESVDLQPLRGHDFIQFGKRPLLMRNEFLQGVYTRTVTFGLVVHEHTLVCARIQRKSCGSAALSAAIVEKMLIVDSMLPSAAP